jgi:hypothetical protein
MKRIYSLFYKTFITNNVMMFFVVLSCLFVTNASAQIGVTVTNNTNTTPNLAGSYTSFAAALTDLNAVTAMSGPITLTLSAGAETTPPTGLVLGSATLSPVLTATNAITIVGSGVSTVLNAGVGTATPASAIPDGILKLNGADYVTIDGLTFTDGNTTNPATMEVGIGMFKLSVTDGCQNNTIQNCIFNMQRINGVTGSGPMVEGSVGIAVLNSTITTSTTALTITAVTGASSNNKFYANTINGGNYGIVLRGFVATTPFAFADTNNDIGGFSVATGNTILNYGGAALSTNPSAGIRIADQWSFNASFNTINNNNGAGVNHLSTLRGIITSGGTSASGNINNNNVTVTGGGTTTALDGISNAAGGTPAGNTININNNTVVINYPTNTSAAIGGIANNSAGNAAIVNINNNTISAGSAMPGTGTHILIAGGSPTILNINNNTLSNYTRSTNATGILRGITIASPTTSNINNNAISNLAYTNAASTGTIDGIYGQSSSVNITISNNQVNNLITAGGNIRGIFESAIAGNKNIVNNTIHTFSNTAGYTGTGVTYSGIVMQSAATTNISQNKIYNITSLGTTGANTVGISLTNGIAICTISNNIIGHLYTPTATGFNAIRGIDVSGGATVNVHHNTVRLDATSASTTTFGTSCLYFTTTPSSFNVRNNIFVNASTPAQNGANSFANGVVAGIRRSSGTAGTVPGNYGVLSNNNLIFVDAVAGTNNHLTYCEAQSAAILNPINTLTAFKTFMVNRDQLSIDENPNFVSTTATDVTYLHINTTVPTLIESGASNLPLFSTDFDGDIRQGNAGYLGTGFAPDMGADEFEGVSSLPACSGAPAAATTLANNVSYCVGGNSTLSLSANYPTTGITYQWQSSLDNVTYSPIAGGNTITLNVTPTTPIWYQCLVTCTNSALAIVSTPVQVNVLLPTYATLPYAQSFETTWLTTCVSAPLGGDVPDASWRMIKGVDNDASWRADNTTTALSGWLSTSGAYSPLAQDGARSARFHSYNVSPAGDKGSLDLHLNLSEPGSKQLSFWYITPSTGVDQLEALLSEDGGLTFNTLATTPALAAPATAVTTWTNVIASITSVSPNAIVRFRATGDNGSFDIGLDNVSISLPCAGLPVAGTVIGNGAICNGTSSNLSLIGNSSGLGISYQWQASTDNVNFSPIVGAVNSSFIASPLVSTWYRCEITCVNSTLSSLSPSYQVSVIQPTYATIPYTQSFEATWLTTCVSAPLGGDIPDASWRMIKGVDNDASWRADNTTTTLSGWSSLFGVYSPIAQNGARSARFHSYNVFPTGDKGSLDLHLDLSTPGTKQLSFWYITPSTGIDQLEVLFSEDAGLTFNPLTTTPALAAPATAVTAWTNAIALTTSVSPTAIVRFRATGDNGSFDIGLDNVSITQLCSGTPTAGTIIAPSLACSGTPFNLSLATSSTGLGITYQWQSSPDGIVPYTDIVGQTSATATVSQTTASFYQCVVTCSNGGGSVTTVPVQVNMNQLINCFCPAAVTSTGDTEIGNVTFGALNNGTASPILNNTTAVNTYSSFTSLPATNIVQGATTAFSLSQITSATTFYAAFANVFIDYNGNGVFDLPAERALSVGPTVATPLNNVLTGNITVPVTSVTGAVLMRVVLLEGGSATTPACSPLGSTTTYGEVEDYVLNITPCVTPLISVQPISSTTVCSGTDVVLSTTASGTNVTYQWRKDGVNVALATTASITISGNSTNSGNYTILVTGACGSILSDTAVVTINPNVTPTFAPITAVCTGGVVTLPLASIEGVTGTWSPAIDNTTTTTYTFSPASGQCVAPGVYTLTVSVNPNVTPTFAAIPAICSGGVINLPTSSIEGVTGSWSPAINNTATTIYTFTPSVGQCVAPGVYTQTVTVNPNVTPTFAAISAICTGGSFTLPTASIEGITGTWAPAIDNTATTIYTFTPAAGQCVTPGVYTLTVAVNPTVTPTFAAIPAICTGGVITLPTASIEGVTGIWSPAVNNTATTTYTFAPTAGQCVAAGVYTLTVTVNAATFTTTNVTVCDTYTWAENGTTYTVGGTYTNITTNPAGCPNTATLNLIVTNASIDFANLQFPSTATICEGGTITAYGQVYEAGLTEAAGQATGINVEFGYNTSNTNPNTWTNWSAATFNVQTGNNDEYLATTSATLTAGTYYYTFRYRLVGCSAWQYGGNNNGFWNGTTQNSGILTINAATTPTGATAQTIIGSTSTTVSQIVATPSAGATLVWYATLADATAGTNALSGTAVLVDGNTYYGVSVNGTCRSSALAVNVTVVLGSSSFDLSQLAYYPNPVKDIFNVKYNKEIISLDVYDLSGRKIIEIKPNTLDVQINMAKLSSAMYIVRLQSIDGITELKVYKN